MASQLGDLERRIKRLSKQSRLAPREFLESELKRFTSIRQIKAILRREIWPEAMVKHLEWEFKIYFEPETTKIKLSSDWQFPYAGCNGGNECFLIENRFHRTLPKLGLGQLKEGEIKGQYRYVETVAEREVLAPIRRYLIALGFLYPNSDGTVQVHGNARLGQKPTLILTTGNAFLSRDRSRRPLYEIQSSRIIYQDLTDLELWKFWGDLLALEVSGSLYYNYWGKEFKRRDQGLPLRKRIREALDFGHTLVPQRYVCKEPKIEEWGWNEDCLGKYLPKVLEKFLSRSGIEKEIKSGSYF